MCAAMALFCIAAALERTAFRITWDDGHLWHAFWYFAFFGGVISAIAGVGAITEERIPRIIRPLAAIAILGFVLFLCACIAWMQGE